MIIWRGWGILGILVPGLFGVLLAGMGPSLGVDEAVLGGAGVAIGGIGAFFLGKWFNETNAAQKAAQWREARQQELMHLIHAGQFQVAPGYAQPSNLQEAQAQASAMLQAEHTHVAKQLRNRHTLFWVPMQWIGIVTVGLGLMILVLALIG